ncbi:DNA polymerase thumb domain-containing protein [Culicoidibacter larvae]|uniref:Damage repair protein n=1 Tax=Culicoidibacter larvae TaxID=2579976 RepID=A0A5R8Q8W5_9FIRM|nr:damage repair protein [Culicoidibacter larvae]TLG72154.1 damage repair protein [Culicoidibacter larvae]
MRDDLEQYRLYDTIMCIDLKSFFASVECVDRNRDPMNTPLLVADTSRGGGTIVLAVSPYLKRFGVPNRLRLWEVNAKIGYMIAKPRMALYLEYSRRVFNIYLKYVSVEDLFAYSIDEAFLDLTSYMSLYQKTAREVAKMILDDIHSTLGLYATVGIGQNMVMAKMAMDIGAKHAPDFIAEWNYQNLAEHLWPVTELSSVWGIGRRTAKKLYTMGIYSMYDLAHYDPEKLNKLFGVRGQELYLHAHGIDISKVSDKYKLGERKSYSIGQTLFHSYFNEEIATLLWESSQEIARRLRADNRSAATVFVYIGYSHEIGGGSIHKQIKLEQPTNDASEIFRRINVFLQSEYQKGAPVRRINIGAGGIQDFNGNQLSLFEHYQDYHALNIAIDELKLRFGKNAILYGSSYTKGGTLKERNQLIGGHKL